MGCGCSSAFSVHDRRAYHGVAVALPPCNGGAETSTRSLTQGSFPSVARRSHGRSTDRDLNDGFHFDVNEVLQRKMRLSRLKERRRLAAASTRQVRRNSRQMPRQDYLTDFGKHHLAMVDEMSRLVASGSDKKLSDCTVNSVSGTLPSLLTMNGSSVFVNRPTVRVNTCLLQHLSEPPQACSPFADPPGRLWCSFQQGVSSGCASSSLSSARRFQKYALHPCNCGHAHRSKLVLFAVHADILLSCSTKDHHMIAYHVTLGSEVGRLVGHDDLILGGAVSSDDTLVATTSRDCTAILWELPSCKQRRSLPHPRLVQACRFSSSGTELATACADGLCRIWTWSTTGVFNSFVSPDTGINGALSSLAYSLGDKALLAGGLARNVYVWDRQSFGEPGPIFQQHQSAVISVDASRTHQDIVMTAEEALLLVWNCATLEVLQRIDVGFCTARLRRPQVVNSTASERYMKRTTFPRELYWTAVRLMDSCYGLVVVAAASDKCVYLFELGGAMHTTRLGGDTQTQFTGAALQGQLSTPSEVLSLSFSSSVSSIDGGPPNRVALGDTCGNRYVLELS
ncbi:hypothetical protein LSCM1_00059 [Leishmania martiniquensis]|uniref:Guanine nucleotide-binding protein subunit beta-like protein n=1 Tax=Leishmania martiniquensis TaxID=1580590 RepID=A0A836GRZ7_9TRYP|nr:hypothetical protein LSCM1_00059 [Leishmania martiniquensis]